MYLPPELLQMIVTQLPKRDLKSCRLAFMDWDTGIIPLLFNSVIITARYAELEVAEQVAARFGASVDTLVYSFEFFKPLGSFEEYAKTAVPSYKMESRPKYRSCYESHAKQCWKTHGKLGKEQREINKKGRVLTQLIRAFETMPRISKIILTHSWRKRVYYNCEEATIEMKGRSYKPSKAVFACSNPDCNFGMYHRHRCPKPMPGHQSPAKGDSWWVDLFLALNKTKKSVQELVVEHWPMDDARMPVELWQSPLPSGLVDSFSTLTKLQLTLEVEDSPNIEELPWKSQIFTQALSSAVNLETLNLALWNTEWASVDRWEGTDFGALLKDCAFPKLLTLGLDRCTADEDEIVAFLKKSPDLHCLSLGRFRLIGGYWISLVQDIRDTTKVKDLRIEFLRGEMVSVEDDVDAELDVGYCDLEDELLHTFYFRPKGSVVTAEDVMEFMDEREMEMMYNQRMLGDSDDDGMGGCLCTDCEDFYDDEEDGEVGCCGCHHHHCLDADEDDDDYADRSNEHPAPQHEGSTSQRPDTDPHGSGAAG